MSRRKEQDYEGRRQQILDGALHVFASKGFEQATNKAIAEVAGIGSPGLIYHYFKDKGDLFRQVVEEKIPLLQLVAHPGELMALPPQEVLTQIGAAYLKIVEDREAIALMKLIFGEAIRQPQVGQMLGEVGPGRVLRFLADYLRRQMEAGTLRCVDPGIAARCFMSPLVVFVLGREVLQLPDAATLDPETMLATTVEIFLRGLQPDSA
jgi:AcrR family transcriptional regulator